MAVFCHELLRAKGRKFQDQVQSHSIDVLLGEFEVMVRHTIGMQPALGYNKHGEHTTVDAIVLPWHGIEGSDQARRFSRRTLPSGQLPSRHVQQGIQVADESLVCHLRMLCSLCGVEKQHTVARAVQLDVDGDPMCVPDVVRQQQVLDPGELVCFLWKPAQQLAHLILPGQDSSLQFQRKSWVQNATPAVVDRAPF
jgi:hypothetical protein